MAAADREHRLRARSGKGFVFFRTMPVCGCNSCHRTSCKDESLFLCLIYLSQLEPARENYFSDCMSIYEDAGTVCVDLITASVGRGRLTTPSFFRKWTYSSTDCHEILSILLLLNLASPAKTNRNDRSQSRSI